MTRQVKAAWSILSAVHVEREFEFQRLLQRQQIIVT